MTRRESGVTSFSRHDEVVFDVARATSPEEISKKLDDLSAEAPGRVINAIYSLGMSARLVEDEDVLANISKALVAKLGDENYEVRVAAVTAVGQCGHACANELVESLSKIASIQDSAKVSEEKVSIMQAIIRAKDFGPREAELGDIVEQIALNDKNSSVRGWACRAIGLTPLDVPQAVDTLKFIAQSDEYEFVRSQAVLSLEVLNREKAA